ncbi:MAG: hypothetical protein QOC55_41 [Thermoleophilaceae bacterium]|nr:hypothetical protein [Thermoleophilaceae bacterium]
MTIVPQLERSLVDAARRDVAAIASRSRPRMRPSLVVAIVLTLLALAAAALAASGLIGSGPALHPPRGVARDPHSGIGTSQPGAQLLNVAVPDPAGGPPWGLRFVTTSRGLGCLEAGRLVDGRIGVLGQDGAFHDDGRFHPLTSNYLGGVASPFPCGGLDARGHAFGSAALNGVPASGLLIPSATQPGCVGHRDHGPIGRRRHHVVICPRADWRLVYFGMAGPEATSVSYRAPDGRSRSVATTGDQGAYLIVLKPPHGAHGLGQYMLLPGAGAGPIERIQYRGGRACTLRRSKFYDGPGCPPVGQVLPKQPRLTRKDVAAPVSARIDGKDLVVSFTARVPVTDARSAYMVTMRLPGASHGVNCGATEGGPLIRDVKAGAHEEFRLPTQGCKGHFSGSVSFSTGENVSGFGPGSERSLQVGSFSLNAK